MLCFAFDVFGLCCVRTTWQQCLITVTHVFHHSSLWAFPCYLGCQKVPGFLYLYQTKHLWDREHISKSILFICHVSYQHHLNISHGKSLHEQHSLVFGAECSLPLKPEEGTISSIIKRLARSPPHHWACRIKKPITQSKGMGVWCLLWKRLSINTFETRELYILNLHALKILYVQLRYHRRYVDCIFIVGHLMINL